MQFPGDSLDMKDEITVMYSTINYTEYFNSSGSTTNRTDDEEKFELDYSPTNAYCVRNRRECVNGLYYEVHIIERIIKLFLHVCFGSN